MNKAEDLVFYIQILCIRVLYKCYLRNLLSDWSPYSKHSVM